MLAAIDTELTMAIKASQAGWVIEVTRPARGTEPFEKSVEFNVAIAEIWTATAAAARKWSYNGSASGRPIRPLSAAEIKLLGLEAGEVKLSRDRQSIRGFLQGPSR
jgi:hypothetical protein